MDMGVITIQKWVNMSTVGLIGFFRDVNSHGYGHPLTRHILTLDPVPAGVNFTGGNPLHYYQWTVMNPYLNNHNYYNKGYNIYSNY